jgi:hypothetical protein
MIKELPGDGWDPATLDRQRDAAEDGRVADMPQWAHDALSAGGHVPATIERMSPDFRASDGPAKPTLDGIEEKWSRRWEEARVVQV